MDPKRLHFNDRAKKGTDTNKLPINSSKTTKHTFTKTTKHAIQGSSDKDLQLNNEMNNDKPISKQHRMAEVGGKRGG